MKDEGAGSARAFVSRRPRDGEVGSLGCGGAEQESVHAQLCRSAGTVLDRRPGVQIHETVLNGTHEAMINGRADLGIGPVVPKGFLGDALMQVRFIPVAHPDHALHQLGRELRMDDLYRHRRLVIRESGLGQALRADLEGDQRLTVSHKPTSIRAACMGLGFAWYPEESVRAELDTGELKILSVHGGGARYTTLYLMIADEDSVGPATRKFAALIKESVEESRLEDSG